jgi:hypothetical protein
MPQALGRICALQKSIRNDEDGKTGMPQSIKPGRGLQPGAKQAAGREYARKGQHPRDDDQRRIEVSTRYRKQGTRPQDGELGEQQHSREQIDHEYGGSVSRDEGADPARLDG